MVRAGPVPGVVARASRHQHDLDECHQVGSNCLWPLCPGPKSVPAGLVRSSVKGVARPGCWMVRWAAEQEGWSLSEHPTFRPGHPTAPGGRAEVAATGHLCGEPGEGPFSRPQRAHLPWLGGHVSPKCSYPIRGTLTITQQGGPGGTQGSWVGGPQS